MTARAAKPSREQAAAPGATSNCQCATSSQSRKYQPPRQNWTGDSIQKAVDADSHAPCTRCCGGPSAAWPPPPAVARWWCVLPHRSHRHHQLQSCCGARRWCWDAPSVHGVALTLCSPACVAATTLAEFGRRAATPRAMAVTASPLPMPNDARLERNKSAASPPGASQPG